MPRRRISIASLSSEHSTNSDQTDNLNITEELPDPGLHKRTSKDAKEKKKVSFNFPVEVITKDGRFSGMGTVDLEPTVLEKTSKVRKTKAELKEVVPCYEDLLKEEKQPTRTKRKDGKNQKKPPVDRTNKKDAAKEAREVKEAKKREVQARRDVVKKAVEEEKATKEEFEENNKLYKPGECLKHMSIELHPSLARAWYMADTLREVSALGVRVAPADTICDDGLLVWSRRVPPTLAAVGGQVALARTRQQCPHSLYILPAERLCALGGARCARHVADMRALAGTHLTLLVFGANAFCTSLPSGGGAQQVTREKFAKIIADLQIELVVSHRCDLFVVETPAELASLVLHYTRAVAEAPYKKAKRDIDEQAEFYMRGDNKNCVTVDRDGNGLSRLWEQMIAILPQSSLEVARTLGAEYTTPSALLQEFQNIGGVAKIADIGVVRANVPGAKTRRLGGEFARKLHTLFTTEDGNIVIE